MNTYLPTLSERFEGCIIGGAIGDAWGSGYENLKEPHNPKNFYLKPEKEQIPAWCITDDTQLTLVTCEAIADHTLVTPDILANYFLRYYKQRKLTGIGASTLKALQELEIGGHWSLVGRTGEYAAGNGAALRIAPFAFIETIGRNEIRDFCRLTHKNDEAYTGGLAVFLSIRAIINHEWKNNINLIDLVIPQLPDTKVRDRLNEISKLAENKTISDVAKLKIIRTRSNLLLRP